MDCFLKAKSCLYDSLIINRVSVTIPSMKTGEISKVKEVLEVNKTQSSQVLLRTV